jgi:hypothetical protein
LEPFFLGVLFGIEFCIGEFFFEELLVLKAVVFFLEVELLLSGDFILLLFYLVKLQIFSLKYFYGGVGVTALASSSNFSRRNSAVFAVFSLISLSRSFRSVSFWSIFCWNSMTLRFV